LYLQYTNITSLPDNLTVNGYLNLYNTQITDIPQNLKIYESLMLDGTSLANYYTRKQIRKMIEEKGGFLKGYIY
jgi:Leucine-rich repeat (LRR) protein